MTTPRNSAAGPRLTAQVERSKMKVKNLQPLSQGQQGAGDRTQSSVPLFSSNPETFTDYRHRYQQYVAMFTQSWEARKIVVIPVDDALRKPFTLKGISDDAVTILKKKFDRLQLIPALKRSLKLERLLGGSLTFMGLEAEEDDPSKEYLPKKEAAKLRFINTIPVSRISRMTWETDPLVEGYMRPSSYSINGQDVHTSRTLVWDGEPLFDPQDAMLTPYRSNLAGFGPSVLGCLWDDIIAASGSRQAAYQMVQINGALIATIEDLQDITGTNPGQRNLKKIQDLINQLSVYRAGIVNGDKVKVESHSSPFGSVPDLLITYLQVLSAASDIPASRFLGTAPGGLSTDDRAGLENYYNKIDAFQHERITPQLLRLCDIIGYAEISDWHQQRDLLEIEWPPLWNETAKEMAERAGLTIDYVMKLVDASLMGDEQALEEINARGILSVKLDADDLALLQAADDAMGGNNPGDGGPPEGGQKPEPQVDAGKEIERLKNATFVRHYFNPRTNKLACSQKVGMSGGSLSSARLWTEDYPPRTHTRFQGLDIMVETAKGETRKGRNPVTMKVWETVMPCDYGELPCAGGVDGDHVDCYLGPDEDSQEVWIVDQNNLDSTFDEHKVMLGFTSEEEAIKTYCQSFSDSKGFDRLGKIQELSMNDFKLWLAGQTHVQS